MMNNPHRDDGAPHLDDSPVHDPGSARSSPSWGAVLLRVFIATVVGQFIGVEVGGQLAMATGEGWLVALAMGGLAGVATGLAVSPQARRGVWVAGTFAISAVVFGIAEWESNVHLHIPNTMTLARNMLVIAGIQTVVALAVWLLRRL